MTWQANKDALRGRVAVVAGATRGAGRGVAAALGEAGATVICTGRSTRAARSEYAFGVSEASWRDALARERADAKPNAPPDFALSESPRYVGRAVAALAADPHKERWNQKAVSSGELARAYGFTDVDGSRPDIWRYMAEVHEQQREAKLEDYR